MRGPGAWQPDALRQHGRSAETFSRHHRRARARGRAQAVWPDSTATNRSRRTKRNSARRSVSVLPPLPVNSSPITPDQPTMAPRTQSLQRAALVSYLLLILLTLLWEGWLAPAPKGPPGFWLTGKALLLLLPPLGMLRDEPRGYLW